MLIMGINKEEKKVEVMMAIKKEMIIDREINIEIDFLINFKKIII
jgi:hypothetical protein